MSQTLLAFLAFMVATQVAFNQQRAALQSQIQMVNSEVTNLATSAGLDILTEISALDFDSATSGGAVVTDASNLSSLPFTSGGTFADADDIDDVHEIQTYTYQTELADISFDVEFEVRYVNEADVSVVENSQTFAKEVVLTLDNPNLFTPITISQVYTYP